MISDEFILVQHKILVFIFALFASNILRAQGIEIIPCEGRDCLLAEFTKPDGPTESAEKYFDGAYTSYISDDCHYQKLENLLAKNILSTSEFGSVTSNWIKSCEEELSHYSSSSLLSMLRLEFLKYPFEDNPNLNEVVFTYDEGTKVRGILALKDNKKRPLVIVKNGVFGNAGDSTSIKTMLMHLTEEAPFHLLALGNMTGDDFIKDNGFIGVGGFEEGRQIHEVVKLLLNKNSPIKEYIYDIHMIGVSLGGNAALFSSLYNSYIEDEKYRIQSHIAYCPVVNLEKSIHHVYRPTGLGLVFSFITKGLLENIYDFVPYLWDLFDPEDRLKRSKVKKILVEGALKSLKDRTSKKEWDYPPFEGVVVSDKKQFWDLNDFTKYYDQVNGSTLVIHSRDDFVVESKNNADSLRKIASDNNNNIGFVNLNKGGHCAFSISYGWPTFSKIVKNYILTNSSYKQNTTKKIYPLIFKKSVSKRRDYRFSKYRWLYNYKRPGYDLEITYRLDRKSNARGTDSCKSQDYRFSDLICYYTKKYKINSETFYNMGLKLPTNDYQAAKITRWLNTHLQPVNEKGDLPYGLGEIPFYVKYNSIN